MRRIAALSLLATLAISPAAAQTILQFGVGDGGDNSSATVTTQQALPQFDGPFTAASVLSGVNVRSAPTSHGSSIVGTLHGGDVISVRCKFGWCELANAGGYTAEKFLSLDGSAQSFEVVQPPAEGTPGTGDAPPIATPSITADGGTFAVPANFDGLWTMIDPAGKPGMPLILKQIGNGVTGTLQSADRVAKLTGDIQGYKLTFTYNMLNKAGKTIASGNGFMTMAKDGASLTGSMMLNGLVIGNINATH